MPYLFKRGESFKRASTALNQHYRKVERGEGENLYLVCGEDDFLVRQVTKRLMRALLKQQTDDTMPFTVLEGEGATDTAVADALRSIGFGALFGNVHLVVIRDPAFLQHPPFSGNASNGKCEEVSQFESAVLQVLARGLPHQVVALFSICAPLPDSHPLLQLIVEHGVVIFLNRVRVRELPTFIRLTAKRLGVRIHQVAIDELLERVGDNLWQLNAELEKLANYVGERKEIELDDVRTLVPSLTGDVFQLIDFIAQGDVAHARMLLHALLQRREPLPRILYMLARQYRLLLQARWLLEQRVISSQLLRRRTHEIPDYLHERITDDVRMRLPENARLNLLTQNPYAIRIAVEQAQALPIATIIEALSIIRDADVALKTTGARDEELADWLVIQLCQLTRNSTKSIPKIHA